MNAHEVESEVSVFQWNVLSDQLCFNFPGCKEKFLDWEYRGPRIINAILEEHCDVVCLEEVDKF